MSSLKFLALGSGSKGNCTFIGTPHAQVLIDCGLSPRRVFTTLRQHGIDPLHLDAVFITHLHTDHVKDLASLLRYIRPRVYCDQRITAEVAALAGLAGGGEGLVAGFASGEGFHHRDLDILPVPVSHDADPTVAYKFFCNSFRAGVLTDLGEVEEAQLRTFGDCDILLLEANHCPELLASGPYPETLKRRIRSRHGHLSNEQAVQFTTGLAHMPQHLLLGHLSEQNNRPEAVHQAFTRIETGAIPHTVLTQRHAGPLLELA